MPRNRFVQSLILLAGIVVVVYLLISLYLPSSRWLIFGIDKHSGRVRLVEQRVTYLPPYQSYRLRFGVSGDRFPDAQRMVNDGWNSWIRARVGEAVAAVTSQIQIEDLLSPTSQFNSQREPLRQIVARHLAASGLKV